MNGYWHFIALSAGISALIIVFGNYWFVLGFLAWLFYLYVFRGLGWIKVLCSCLAFIFFMYYIPSPDPPSTAPSSDMKDDFPLSGIIKSPLKETPSYIQFVFQEEGTDNRMLVYYFKHKSDRRIGQVAKMNAGNGQACEINGTIDTVQSATNPGQFDFNAYLNQQGLVGQITVESPSDIDCTTSHPMSYIYSFRSSVMSFVHSNLSTFSSAWVTALLFGEDSFLPDDTIQLFQYWGLSHLLAISGLHVGLIVSLLYF